MSILFLVISHEALSMMFNPVRVSEQLKTLPMTTTPAINAFLILSASNHSETITFCMVS